MQTFYRRSSDNGATWDSEIQLTNAALLAYSPMVYASDSNIDLVWENRDANNFYDIFYHHSTDFGATWGMEHQLSPGSATSTYPVVVRSGSKVHVVWGNFNGAIYYDRSDDGGVTWSQPEALVVAGSHPGSPFMAVSGPTLHAIWVDQRDGNHEVFYTRNPTGNTSSANVEKMTGKQELLTASPNPFNASTSIVCALPESTIIIVYDIIGREVLRLPTRNGAILKDRDLFPGIYFLEARSAQATASLWLLHE
jgi:hypothetical protein